MKHSSLSLVLFPMLLAVGACRQEQPLFVQLRPEQTGIHFANRIHEDDTFNILTFEYVYNGGGVAVGDFNNDGLQDMFFSANTSNNKLYINKGDFRFQDITQSAGVSGEGRWCSGVAAVDINADGWLDLYVGATAYEPGSRRANLLYVNQGASEDGAGVTFREMAAAYGLADTSHTTTPAFFDYDNDGDLDLYLVINEMDNEKLPNKYRKKITDGSSKRTDKLYRNDWNDELGHPRFTDVSAQAGITIEGYGLGVGICDINDDGWRDVYVTNDYLSNDLLWINNGNGTFTDRAAEYFKHTCYAAMGNDIADLNNDALPDIVALDMLPEDNHRRKTMLPPNNYFTYLNNDRFGYQYQYVRNMLQLNQGKRPDTGEPLFCDVSMLAGIPATDWSWSPLAADFDHDGYRDLFITNGFPRDVTDRDFMDYHVEVGAYSTKEMLLAAIPAVKIKNYAYRNGGGNMPTFQDVTTAWGLTQNSFSNGAAYADLDNDGDLDYIVNNINDSAFVYRNTLVDTRPDSAHWLKIKLKGEGQNLHGLGVTITVNYATDRQQVWHNNPYRGYLSSVENGAHFGFGAVKRVDELVIRWPGGKTQRLRDVSLNQSLMVEEKNAVLEPPVLAKPAPTLFQSVAAELGIDYLHRDSNFIDFDIQRLLPHKLSQYGPAIAVGDVDGDGLDDFYVSGSHFYKGRFFLQKVGGGFVARDLLPDPPGGVKLEEELGSLLFDVDNDGDNDLYLVSGGNEFPRDNACYQDRLFLNEGGRFTLAENALPELLKSGSCLKAADFDRDGDLDLFIGGRVVPAEYPKPTSSYLLRNDTKAGQVKFSLVNDELAADLNDIGMVCDALWTDVDADGWVDLMISGEWMPLHVLKNEKGKFSRRDLPGLDHSSGLWNSLAAADFDRDGDMDYVAGNLGRNTLFKASDQHPLAVYAADFDGNLGIDVIPSAYFPDRDGQPREFPYFQRLDVEKQVVKVKGLYPRHKDFGAATMQDLVAQFPAARPLVLQATCTESAYIENLGDGRFQLHPLPLEAQVAPVYGILAEDFNGDGHPDLLLSGNDYGTEVGMGRYDASNGLLLLGDGRGRFRPLRMAESGICIPDDAKSLSTLRAADGGMLVLAGQNQGPLQVYRPRQARHSILLQPLDYLAILHFKDGASSRRELPYGQGFLSQSSRTLFTPSGVTAVELMDYQGKKRRVEVGDGMMSGN